jgi:hypothetical protein
MSVMKRYMLKFRSMDSSVTTHALHEELEQLLLRLHPRITYKIKQVSEEKNGILLAEIGLEGNRDLLESALKSRQWNIPIRLESMVWGWGTKYEEDTLTTPTTSGIDIDPLARISPLDRVGEFQSGRKLWLRYILLVISTLAIIFLLGANAYDRDSPMLQGIYIVAFLVWLIVLNETPFNFKVYAATIICNQEGIKVKYWYRKLPEQIGWEEVQRMEFTEPVCQIFSENKKIRFLVSEKFGCKEQKLVLKTIVDRASLNYVRGNFMTMEYRRYDA